MIIGGVGVGLGHQTYVIAEIGSNHDGLLDRARLLIQDAADAGADCAKFQLFRADKLYPGQHIDGAIPDEWLPELKAACHEAGVEFMCSVFCDETLEAYMAVDPAAVKIASPEAMNRDLIRAAGRYGKPLIVSTGAMDDRQTRDLIIFAEQRLDWPCELALLHCVSDYPAKDAELNLLAVGWLADKGWVSGFSDHTLDPVLVPALAVAAGASIIEKHMTYDRAAAGADHPFALEPDEFAEMVQTIRRTELVLGDGVKRVTASEDPTDRRQAA